MKKLMTMVAGVGAFALCASAGTQSWFNGGIAAGWPQAATLSGGIWTETAGGSFEDQVLEIDADADNRLEFTASVTNDFNVIGGAIKFDVDTTMSFVPYSELPEVPEVKAAVIVLKGANDALAYYGLAWDAVGSTNGWFVLAGTPVENAEVNVKISITPGENGLCNITYRIGEDATAKTIASDGRYSTVGVTGTGTMTALSATRDFLTAPTHTLTLAAAPAHASWIVTTNDVPVAGDNGVYTLLDGAMPSIVLKADQGYLFADGTDEVVTLGVVMNADVDKSDETPEAPAQAKAKIGSQLYLTLSGAVTNAADGATVTLLANVTDSLWCGSGNSVPENTFPNGLTIDLDGNTWTIAPCNGSSVAIYPYRHNKLTFRNGTINLDEASAIEYFTYSYAELLEFDNVALDLTKLDQQGGDGYINNPREHAAFVAQNGGLKIWNGSTVALDGSNGERLATFVDRAGAQYEPGTFTLDVNGTVPGDILLIGDFGFVKGQNTVLGGDVYFGEAGYSDFQFAKAGDMGFEAAVGVIRDTHVVADGYEKICGKLYTSLTNAVAAAVDGDRVTVVGDATVDKLWIAKGGKDAYAITISNLCTVTFTDISNVGDYSIKLNGATLTLTGSGTWAKPAAVEGGSLCQCGADSEAVLVIDGGIYIGGTNGMASAEGPSNLFTTKWGSITVNGGTFVNYRADQGRCVRGEGGTGKAVAVTINAGDFTVPDTGVGINTAEGRLIPVDNRNGKSNTVILIPTNSTAVFTCYADNADYMNRFCEEGYELALNGEGRYVVAKAVTGPVIADSTPDFTIELDTDSGEYVVTPTAGSTSVKVDNVGDAIIRVPSTVTSVFLNGASNIGTQLKVMSGTYDITAVMSKTSNGSTGYTDLALNPEASVNEVPVTPVIGDAPVTTGEPFTVGESATVKVRVIPGLYYSLMRYATLADTTGTCIACQMATSADEGVIAFIDVAKPADKAFYRIVVSLTAKVPVNGD